MRLGPDPLVAHVIVVSRLRPELANRATQLLALPRA